MKKWLVGFVALFVAVGAYAQDLNSYMPADAMVVGSADGSAILDSTFIRRVIFISTQMTVDDILKEKGLTMEQAKNNAEPHCSFLKLLPATRCLSLKAEQLSAVLQKILSRISTLSHSSLLMQN